LSVILERISSRRKSIEQKFNSFDVYVEYTRHEKVAFFNYTNILVM